MATVALTSALITIIGAFIAPAPAYAHTCSDGYFCYYTDQSLGGFEDKIYYYSTQWNEFPVSVGVESSLDYQTSDWCDGQWIHPVVRFRGWNAYGYYMYAEVGSYYGNYRSSFNPMTSYSPVVTGNFNNFFDEYYNYCP